jgi:hypothetical protein
MKLCYVFSRYAREPEDGKQAAFWRQLDIFARLFDEVAVIGLARSKQQLKGHLPVLAHTVSISESVLGGSYALQFGLSGIGLKTTTCGLLAPQVTSWLRKEMTAESIVFLEGAPLVGLAPTINSGRLFYGEVDSYSRRAKRFGKAGQASFVKTRFSIYLAMLVERESLRRVKRAHVYSEEDASFLTKLYRLPPDKIMAIPMPLPEFVECERHDQPLSHGVRFLIWADAKYPHLETGVKNVLNELCKACISKHNVCFLVGKNPGLVTHISELGFPAIQWAPSIEETLLRHDVVIIPDVVGTGIKNRTIHAMAMGKCVVGTKFAWEGIPYHNESDGICAESAAKIVAIAEDMTVERALGIGAAARLSVSRLYGRSILQDKWRQFFYG